MTVETITLSPTLRVRIEQDQESMSPQDWDNLGEIAYCSSRETLGTENVSRERLREISDGIQDRTLIGVPVYAYVHSEVMIRTSPFNCPWDSGQSGFAYMSREAAIKGWGKKMMTVAVKEKALKYLEERVEEFNQYLTGDVYGYIVERVKLDEDGEEVGTEHLDSCWGFYGLAYAVSEAGAAGDNQAKLDDAELLERKAWEERDVVTV